MTRTERDRPAALAASTASQAKVKQENALHTPGPWHAEGTGPWDGWDGWEVIAKDGATVCNGLGSQREPIRAANARLIAAAPELLAALQGLVAVLDRQLNSPHAAERASPLGRASAAIKKATGDTA